MNTMKRTTDRWTRHVELLGVVFAHQAVAWGWLVLMSLFPSLYFVLETDSAGQPLEAWLAVFAVSSGVAGLLLASSICQPELQVWLHRLPGASAVVRQTLILVASGLGAVSLVGGVIHSVRHGLPLATVLYAPAVSWVGLVLGYSLTAWLQKRVYPTIRAVWVWYGALVSIWFWVWVLVPRDSLLLPDRLAYCLQLGACIFGGATTVVLLRRLSSPRMLTLPGGSRRNTFAEELYKGALHWLLPWIGMVTLAIVAIAWFGSGYTLWQAVTLFIAVQALASFSVALTVALFPLLHTSGAVVTALWFTAAALIWVEVRVGAFNPISAEAALPAKLMLALGAAALGWALVHLSRHKWSHADFYLMTEEAALESDRRYSAWAVKNVPPQR
jgi:hypothetical protein